MGILARYKKILPETAEFYKSINEVYCPYFRKPVIFNARGFHHLQFSANRERDKKEQLVKFTFLKYVPQIIQNSGTVQEYRIINGVEYWGFIAIVDPCTLVRV